VRKLTEVPSLGAILVLVGTLALIGLGVAVVIGTAIVVVAVAALGFVAAYLYKRLSSRPRYGRNDSRFSGGGER
jgi:hypothetical protein